MNEAIFLSEAERHEVEDGILKKAEELAGDRYFYVTHVLYQGRERGYKITIGENTREFRKEPVVEPWSGYVNRIKAFVFDVM